jgi:hypothetical protein
LFQKKKLDLHKVPTKKGQEHLDFEDLRELARSASVFSEIAEDPCVSLSLPPSGVTAGRVLEHACTVFQKHHSKLSPMTFKFGFTHSPCFRWHSKLFGYKDCVDKFQHMTILFAAANPHAPAFLEAALIREFGSAMALVQGMGHDGPWYSQKCSAYHL